MTQNERVLEHLEAIGPITCRQAAEEYGIMALHSRIADLRREGYDIRSTYKSGKNRFGENCHWYEYELAEPTA